MGKDLAPRKRFEERNKRGTRCYVYPLARLAGGEYVSQFTEEAWKEFLAGWNAAVQEYCA